MNRAATIKKCYEGKVRDNCPINYDFSQEATAEDLIEAERIAREHNREIKEKTEEYERTKKLPRRV